MRHKKLFVNLLFAAVILLAAGVLFALRGAGAVRAAGGRAGPGRAPQGPADLRRREYHPRFPP